METLKIKIPNGYEIDSFDKLSGEIKFREKPKSVLERIKTVSDVLKDNGLSQYDFDRSCDGLEPDEKAYRIIKLLRNSLNRQEDGTVWQPDWSNSNQYKYYPWFEMRGSSGFRFYVYAAWSAASVVGSRLCFKARELAEHAGKYFTDVYKQFMVNEKS